MRNPIEENIGSAMPTARNNGLVVRKLNDEVIVYDTRNQKAHCLNASAALIWEHCNGKRSVKDLSDLVQDAHSNKNQREELVWIALDQLEESNLLEQPLARTNVKGMNRLQILKAAAVAAVAIPIVNTIITPKAAQAVTCLATGQVCTISAECCSGLCTGTCA